MPRPKGSKNKPKQKEQIHYLRALIAKFKELGITSQDLKATYGKGKKFLETDLIKLFEAHKAELQNMQITVKRGRTAGSTRPLNEREIIQKFAERIAEEAGKAAPVDRLLRTLRNEVKDKELKF